MLKKYFIVLLVLCIATTVFSASLLDILSYTLDDDTDTVEKRDTETETVSGKARNCICSGPGCICCVDFNFTYIDLGGPGCVQMKYLSPEQGIALNVSYGQSILHSEVVKGSNPKPTCIGLFGQVAQMCARFTQLVPLEDGLKGCLALEPMLLGEVQLNFNIGCFKMDADGMHMLPGSNSTQVNEVEESSEDTDTTEESNEPEPGINAEQIIAAVNESAEEGIAFFTNLLGLNFGKPAGANATETAEEAPSPPEEALREEVSPEQETPEQARSLTKSDNSNIV